MTEEKRDVPKLPKGWIWTRLGEVGSVAAGGTPSTDDPENFGEDVPWITPADLSGFSGKFISKGRRSLSVKGLSSSSAVLLPAGTVLFSSRAPIGYVAIAANPISTNQGFKNLTCYEGVFNEYVSYYLKGSKRLAESYGSGTTFKEVSASRFARIPFPLCPLPEQRRIVVRVEELFSCLDAGVESLRKVKAQLKRYRQAVLKYAFEGKLTEEWRKTHKDQIEPAQILLERIKQERKKDVKGKYRELPPIDTLEVSELPEGWIWTRLGELLFQSYEKFDPVSSQDEKFVGLEHINSGTGKLLGYGRSSETRSTKSKFRKGDLLYGKLRPYLNKVWLAEIDGVCSTDILVFSKNDFIDNRYLAAFLLGNDFVKYATQHMSGIQHPRVNYQTLAHYVTPLPPILEQHKIAEEIECRLSVADEIEKSVEQSLKQSDQLRQGILRRAFEGKLVPQDPSDEPADRLLERIKEERGKHELETRSDKKSVLRQMELVRYVK